MVSVHDYHRLKGNNFNSCADAVADTTLLLLLTAPSFISMS
jgi:hypothetical protein